MTTLSLIAAEYRAQAELLADLDLPPEVVADTLESIGGELEHKAQGVAFVIRHLRANAATMKEWAKTASERAKAEDARADHLTSYLAHAMQACNITKISGPGVALSFRASHAVVIDEPALIPNEYMRQAPQPAPEPDKDAIKAAIKVGDIVPGAHVETRMNLQIK